jgi:hypothetical protein
LFISARHWYYLIKFWICKHAYELLFVVNRKLFLFLLRTWFFPILVYDCVNQAIFFYFYCFMWQVVVQILKIKVGHDSVSAFQVYS